MLSLNYWRMLSPRLDEDPFCFDFTDEFLAEFGFGTAGGVAATTGVTGDDDGDAEFSFGSYSHEFDNASFTFSVESYVGDTTRHRRKKRRPNRQYRKKSTVKNSCWYREFLRPGTTRDMTNELSTSDRFGEFRSYFRMPLLKVEELTDYFILGDRSIISNLSVTVSHIYVGSSIIL